MRKNVISTTKKQIFLNKIFNICFPCIYLGSIKFSSPLNRGEPLFIIWISEIKKLSKIKQFNFPIVFIYFFNIIQ